MRFLFLFTFHQLVDAWRKLADSSSKLIMLRNNRNSGLQEYLFRNYARYLNWKSVNPGFCEKMEVTRVPPGGSSRTTGWEPLA